MTVKSVQGNWVLCTWWSQGWGGFQSAGFPIAMVAGPVSYPRMTHIHKQQGRRVLPNRVLPNHAYVARVISVARVI
jgi:hypothetical protein